MQRAETGYRLPGEDGAKKRKELPHTINDEMIAYVLWVADFKFGRADPGVDIEGAANEALVNAKKNYDPERNMSWRSYLNLVLIRYLVEETRRGRTKRGDTARKKQLSDVTEHLTRELGREPTYGEIAAELGIPQDKLHERRQELTAAEHPLPLDAPLIRGQDDSPNGYDVMSADNDQENPLSATPEDVDSALRNRYGYSPLTNRSEEEKEPNPFTHTGGFLAYHQPPTELFPDLTKTEKRRLAQEAAALSLTYRHGLTQPEMRGVLGVTPSRISQVLTQANEQLARGVEEIVRHDLYGE